MHDKNIINDAHNELINFYQVAKNEPENLFLLLNKIISEYNSIDKSALSKAEFQVLADKYYYYYRDNIFNTPLARAIAFYMIRQLSFSGMIRYNSEGKYNIPFGWYKKMKPLDINFSLLKSHLDNTEIKTGNWKNGLDGCNTKDFVFLDPPYTREFTSYTTENFGKEEHIELANWFSSKKSKSMIVLNLDDFTKELYKDFIVSTYKHNYSIQYRDRMTEQDSQAIHFIAVNYKDFNNNQTLDLEKLFRG